MTGAWRTIRRNDPADQYPERTDPSSPEFVVLACRTAARLAVAQGASAGDLREVLEALGLIEPLKTILPPEPPTPRPSPRKPPAEVPVTLTDPNGRVLRPQQRAAIAKAHQTLAEEDLEEVPRTDEVGNVLMRCGKRVHYRTAENTKNRTDGGKQCLPCLAVANARSILRNYGLLNEVAG